MLADGSYFTCEEEVDATYGIIAQNTKQVSEQLNSWFRVVDKLHWDVILGLDWFQSVNPQADWLYYGVTLKGSFIAAGVPVHCIIKVELNSFKVMMHFLNANKGINSWFTFISKFDTLSS